MVLRKCYFLWVVAKQFEELNVKYSISLVGVEPEIKELAEAHSEAVEASGFLLVQILYMFSLIHFLLYKYSKTV